jgi:hypothetical protein
MSQEIHLSEGDEARLRRFALLTAEMSRVLAVHMFGHARLGAVDDWHSVLWFRRGERQTDLVRMFLRAGAERRVNVQLRIEPRGRPGAGTPARPLSLVNLHALCGRKTRGYRLGGGLLTWTTDARHIVADLRGAIGWFGDYTPESHEDLGI